MQYHNSINQQVNKPIKTEEYEYNFIKTLNDKPTKCFLFKVSVYQNKLYS
jgi:hypothetical protein